MPEFIKKWVPAIRRILTSWWFLGLLGWVLIGLNYPLENVLPRYAG